VKYLFYFLILTIFSFQTLSGLDMQSPRVKEISKMLTNKSVAPGPSINNRKAWNELAKQPYFKKIVKLAEKEYKKKLPKMTDDLYLEFSRNGNRTHWQSANAKYNSRLRTLVLAECIENKGKYLPQIEKLIKHFCDKKTWLMPAHDNRQRNFYQKQIDIDLGSAMFGWDLATIDTMLDDKLSSQIKKVIRENLEKRIYTPFKGMVTANRKKNWWLTTTNNWNAVCLAGVIGSALPIIESPERRAFFITAAEKYINNFLAGFTPDGNCSEGMAYWNYGFGHFIMLSETIARATAGKLRLMDKSEAKQPALYGFKAEIQNGIYPAFADCSVNAKPDANLLHYINNYYQLGLRKFDDIDYDARGNIYYLMLFVLSDKMVEPGKKKLTFKPNLLRTWFPDAGIYIGRQKIQKSASPKFGVACKGGHNQEHHNHNDVGTFMVVLDDNPVLCDPGAEVYTARTFSKDRYKSNVLNSYGHPVPVIAGKLQQTGQSSQGKILKKSFNKDQDRVVIDIKSAYSVPSLKKLEREFVYSRKDGGSLIVTDTVEFKKPETYEMALITLGNWLKNDDGSLFVYNLDKAVNVTVDAEGKSCEIRSKLIKENVRTKSLPTRIGIKLKEPVKSAKFAIKITPAKIKKDDSLLKNGNFKYIGFGWDTPRSGMGKVSKTQAVEGKWSLKITDKSKKQGSNISSAKIPVSKAGKYVLKGKYFPVSGKGLGMYIKAYNADGKMLNQQDHRGYIAPVGDLKGKSKKWEDFSFPFNVPKGTKYLVLWIHSYSGAQVEGYLDAMSIVPQK